MLIFEERAKPKYLSRVGNWVRQWESTGSRALALPLTPRLTL